jgi:hypothetical protein
MADAEHLESSSRAAQHLVEDEDSSESRFHAALELATGFLALLVLLAGVLVGWGLFVQLTN